MLIPTWMSPLPVTCHLPIRLKRDPSRSMSLGHHAELRAGWLEMPPIIVCFETSASFHSSHKAAGRWQCLLVTTNLGHLLTSNLEVKSSFSHDQVLKGFTQMGKIYCLAHKMHAAYSQVPTSSADGSCSCCISKFVG